MVAQRLVNGLRRLGPFHELLLGSRVPPLLLDLKSNLLLNTAQISVRVHVFDVRVSSVDRHVLVLLAATLTSTCRPCLSSDVGDLQRTPRALIVHRISFASTIRLRARVYVPWRGRTHTQHVGTVVIVSSVHSCIDVLARLASAVRHVRLVVINLVKVDQVVLIGGRCLCSSYGCHAHRVVLGC